MPLDLDRREDTIAEGWRRPRARQVASATLRRGSVLAGSEASNFAALSDAGARLGVPCPMPRPAVTHPGMSDEPVVRCAERPIGADRYGGS